MEEREFKKLLEMFPIVRSRDYCLNDETGREDKEASGTDDQFWEKLKAAAERKVGPEDATKFCKAFRRVYDKVSSRQNSEVIRRFVNATSP